MATPEAYSTDADLTVGIDRQVAIALRDLAEEEKELVENVDSNGPYTEELADYIESVNDALENGGESVTLLRLVAAGLLDFVRTERQAVEDNDEVGEYTDELDSYISELESALYGRLGVEWVDVDDLKGMPAAPSTHGPKAYCDLCLRTVLTNGDTARCIVKQDADGEPILTRTCCTDHDLSEENAPGIVIDAQLTTAAFNSNQLVLTRVRRAGDPEPEL